MKPTNTKPIMPNKVAKKFRRVTLELHKTDIYFLKIDVPVTGNNSEENGNAIKLAWNLLNTGTQKELERFRAGDGFEQKILRREYVEVNHKDIQ